MSRRRAFVPWIATILLSAATPAIRVEAEQRAPKTLTLEEAHDLALKNHPDIAAADYRALASQEVYRENRAALLPQASLYGSAVQAESANTRIMAGGLNNPTVYSREAYGVGISQLITDFGHTSNLAASSKLQASAAAHTAAATRDDVLLEVDRDYFNALRARAIVNVARQTVETRQLLAERVSVLAANQLKSELDVDFAKVALEDARLLLQKAQNDLDSSLASLCTALGLPDLQQFELADRDPPLGTASQDVGALIAAALHARPELARFRDEHEAALHLARSMRDARLPTISAVVAAGAAPSHDVRLPNDYAAGGIQISVPVFAGGLYEGRQHEAEFRAKAAAESLRTIEDQVRRDVRIAWLNLTNARQRLQTSEQLAQYAGNAYQLAAARYRVGSASIVELSQAQLELTSAQIGATTARYDVLGQESLLDYETGAIALPNGR